MADDLTDAETDIQAVEGIDNHPLGFAILRAVRLLRAARQKFAATDDRIAARPGLDTHATQGGAVPIPIRTRRALAQAWGGPRRRGRMRRMDAR